MIDLTKEQDIKELKEAFDYSFKGPLGEKTLKFLEDFCGVWDGGPADEDDLRNHVLQYQKGRRDIALTILTIMRDNWSPQQIAEVYKRIGRNV